MRHFLQEHPQNFSKTKISLPVSLCLLCLCLLCLCRNTIVSLALLFSPAVPLEFPSADSHSQVVASSSKFYFPSSFPPFSPLSPPHPRVLTQPPVFLRSIDPMGLFFSPITFQKKALASVLSWLERRPVDGKVVGLIPSQDTYPGCLFDPQSGHM